MLRKVPKRGQSSVALAIAALLAVTTAALAADAAAVTAGNELFRRQCSACHAVEPGRHKTGPSLAGVVGRRAGSTDFPRYRGFVGADFDWTPERLNEYLADPRAYVLAHTKNASTSMTFRVTDPEQRRDIIAFLETLKAPTQQPPDGGPGTTDAPRQ